MSDTIVLSLTQAPDHSLLADCIAPDRFAALTAKEIASLRVFHGGRAGRLGDFFTVTGERSSNVRLEGDLGRVQGIGTGMTGGDMLIDGPSGRDLGVAMAGGRIEVRGSTSDNVGGAQPGAAKGMTGGEIIIRGGAGDDAGVRMRRGLLVILGDSGRGTGRAMIAGTIVLFGKTGSGAGRFLKRGTIVALQAMERPATYRYACTYRPPHVAVLLRYLRARSGVPVSDHHITGRYERYSGDLAELGKGEILQWAGE